MLDTGEEVSRRGARLTVAALPTAGATRSVITVTPHGGGANDHS